MTDPKELWTYAQIGPWWNGITYAIKPNGEFIMIEDTSITVKAPFDLRATLAKMKSAKEKGVNMSVWDQDIKAVEEAIETIEAIRANEQ